MSSKFKDERAPIAGEFSAQVAAKVRRKLKARRTETNPVWSGLGMMGLVGWSVVIPTLLGAALGIWLDRHQTGQRSWTLALLIGGLMVGCFNAWRWVAKEAQAIVDEEGEDDA
ncbi:MAG: putative F0F1-ATPase subunit [Myxococcaceae bacterium]|nr:putative F0F1-ATPase subunit [Myxococcaceae bacterium]